MPELPEVETILRGIKPHIEKKTITEVIIRQHQLRWPIPVNLNQNLSGRTILQIKRRGKYLILFVDSGGVMIIHLGMSGRLKILYQLEIPQKHDHVDIKFSQQMILRFTDPRRFGAILWTDDNPYQHPLLRNLGPEPLEKDFTANYLWQKTQKSKTAIKTLIMNAHIVVGIGNIYANEALFVAGIHPLTLANRMTKTSCQKLVTAIKTVLHEAIKQGGTTLKDFYNSAGNPGYFFTKLRVYSREGLPCYNCQTHLQSLRLNQRITVYCPFCQV